ncbi:MAG: hypothetical protein KatS3mg068_1249 [Candidatus Sericytochromatia bacterium]|nr:MAG: hypothetical protein KatS3mg068_1249 [Candidatus Sericytochromatia bacterium]
MSLFPNDLSPVSIRLDKNGNGYFLFSAKENSFGETIYIADISIYQSTSFSNLFDKNGRIASQLNLNQIKAGLALSLSSDNKTIYGKHIVPTS